MFILRPRGLGIRLTRKASRLDMLHMGCYGGGFLRLRSRIGLGLLLRQLARMHHHKTECLRDDSAVTVLHLHPAEHALPIPAARRFILGSPRLFHQEGQSGLLTSPGFEGLPGGTGMRD